MEYNHFDTKLKFIQAKCSKIAFYSSLKKSILLLEDNLDCGGLIEYIKKVSSARIPK